TVPLLPAPAVAAVAHCTSGRGHGIAILRRCGIATGAGYVVNACGCIPPHGQPAPTVNASSALTKPSEITRFHWPKADVTIEALPSACAPVVMTGSVLPKRSGASAATGLDPATSESPQFVDPGGRYRHRNATDPTDRSPVEKSGDHFGLARNRPVAGDDRIR